MTLYTLRPAAHPLICGLAVLWFAALSAPAVAGETIEIAQVVVDPTGGGGIAVEQHPPDVRVEQAPPTVDVRQPAPSVRIEQAEPRVEVRQPEATVEVVAPPPSVEVRQAPPRVHVEQRPPRVEVRQAPPEVRVERADADVEVTTETPHVVIQHGAPEVVITRESAPVLPISEVVGRTILSDEGPRIGVVEEVMVERRSDRLFAIVVNSAGVKRAIPYPVLKRKGRFVTAPPSVSRRFRAENFMPVPAGRTAGE